MTSGSAMPVERRMAPAAPPSRPVPTEKTSWMRRRLRRSLKKEFQSSLDGVAEEEDAAEEEEEAEAAAACAGEEDEKDRAADETMLDGRRAGVAIRPLHAMGKPCAERTTTACCWGLSDVCARQTGRAAAVEKEAVFVVVVVFVVEAGAALGQQRAKPWAELGQREAMALSDTDMADEASVLSLVRCDGDQLNGRVYGPAAGRIRCCAVRRASCVEFARVAGCRFRAGCGWRF